MAPLIAHGRSQLFQAVGPSWQHLRGAQAILRMASDERQEFVVALSFGEPLPPEIRLPLPGRGRQIGVASPAARR